MTYHNKMHTIQELKNIPYDAAYRIRKENGNLEDKSIKLLAKSLLPYSNSTELRILSIGCGDGSLEKKAFLRANLADFIYTGIDINEESLNNFKKHKDFPTTKIKLLNNSFDEFLNINKEKFDLILFSHSFYFFTYPDTIISFCLKMLNEKGKIIIINNNISFITKVKDEYSQLLNTRPYITTEYILQAIEKSTFKQFIDIEQKVEKATLKTSLSHPITLESSLLISFLLGIDILTVPDKEREDILNKFKNNQVIDENISCTIIKNKF